MNWTEERIELLKRLWADGHSASQIGKILGVSKNAVVGKAHRMKLAARPSPIKRKKAAEKAAEVAASQAVSSSAPLSTVDAPSEEKTVEVSTPAATTRGVPETTKTAEPAKKAIAVKPVVKPAEPAIDSVIAEPAVPKATPKPRRVAPPPKKKESSEAAREAADRRFFSGATTKKARGPKCLWPIGDPGDADFHFCGEPAVAGKPYCPEHCARAYITKSKGDSGNKGEAAA